MPRWCLCPGKYGTFCNLGASLQLELLLFQSRPRAYFLSPLALATCDEMTTTGAAHHLPPSSLRRVAKADPLTSPGDAVAPPEGAVGGGEAIAAGASIALSR